MQSHPPSHSAVSQRRWMIPLAGAFLLVAALLTALAVRPAAAQSTEPAAPAADATVTVAHFAPFAETVAGTEVDVRVNGGTVITDFVFNESQGGISLPGGVYTIELVLPDDSVALTQQVTVTDDTDYTLAAIGAPPTWPLQLYALVNDDTPPAAGNVKLRVTHLAPFADTAADTAVDICTEENVVVNNLTGVEYTDSSGYFELPAGDYDLKIAQTGTGCTTTLIDVPALRLPAGAIADVFAVGRGAITPTVTSTADLTPLLAPAAVTVAHFAPFADSVTGTAVNIKVDGSTVLTDVLYGAIAGGLEVPAGSTLVEVEVMESAGAASAEAANAVIISDTFDLIPGGDYTVAAVGGANGFAPKLAAASNAAPTPAAGNGVVRITHYAPFAEGSENTQVAICTAENAVVNGLSNVPFDASSGYFELPAGVYDLKIAVAGTDCLATALNLPPFELLAGQVLDLYATGLNTATFPLRVANAGAGWLQLGHFAPFAGTVISTSVDVRVGGIYTATGVTYGAQTPWLSLPPGGYGVDIVPGGAETVALSGTVTVAQDSYLAANVIGGANQWDLQFSAETVDFSAPTDGNGRLFVAHFAPFATEGETDSTLVDICTLDGTVVVPNFAFGDATSALLPAGVYLLKIAPAGTDCMGTEEFAPIELTSLRLAAGDVSIAYATGDGANFPIRLATNSVGQTEVIYMPLVARGPDQNIVEIAAGDDRFETLVTAVTAAGLAETLAGPGPFTVFAPTDDAFDALPAGTLDTLLQDPTGDLRNILLYHVLSGEVPSSAISDGLAVPTVLGPNVTFGLDGDDATINGANIIITDIPATNGVIHVIDAVILPPAP